MPSHLTRHVFRRLLANEPILHRGCLRRRPQLRSSYEYASEILIGAQNGWRSGHQQQQVRTMFNFNMFRKRRDGKEADLDPGIEEMMDLARRQRMRARLPSREDIAHALKQLFRDKKRNSQPILDTQAQLAYRSFKFCQAASGEDGKTSSSSLTLFEASDLVAAAEVLQITIPQASQIHVDLAKALLEQAVADGYPDIVEDCFAAYVASLCATGSSMKARDLLLERESSNPLDPTKSKTRMDMRSHEPLVDTSMHHAVPEVSPTWLSILHGFARENDEVELLQTLEVIEKRNPSHAQEEIITRLMLNFYTTLENLPTIKRWWSKYYERFFQSDDEQYTTSSEVVGRDVDKLLKWCVAHNELQFGHQVVRDVLKGNPQKAVWDAIFVWAASTGKGADEISRMIGVMEKTNETLQNSQQWRIPNSVTINALVEFAISKNDPYIAERFISIGRERNIEPDARTYVLQMEYRLQIHDVDGALIAYKNLQSLNTSSNEDLAAINRLIVSLCDTQRHDFDTIMNVAADLSDRRARFEPETVRSLALLHLSRGEKEDVTDLLNTHAFHYSNAGRETISKAMIGFILDNKTSAARAWDAYIIIKDVFDETTRDQRTAIMTSFFNRSRPDMACNVFLNMRHHTRDSLVPVAETYVAAFTGIANHGDQESLDVIHNQLKLDFNINSTTQLLNSLILAFTACERPRQALVFWDDIVASREGPSYPSLHAALRACEKAPFGDLRAQEIWSLLKRRGVECDVALWASYIAALAGNGDNQLAISTLEAAFDRGELEVDAFLLASLYMAAPGMIKQAEVATWAGKKFPGLWAEIEKMGFEEVDEWSTNKLVIGIDRSITL